MLQRRFFISFVSTVFLYVIVGAAFFYILQKTTYQEEKSQEKTLTFSLSEYVPPEITPMEETIEEKRAEPKEEEKVIEPEPIVEKIQEAPKVVEKTVPKPKPVIKKIVKKKRIVRKKPIVKKKRVKKRIAKKIKKKSAQKKSIKKRRTTQRNSSKRSVPKKVSTAEKNRFLNQIRRKIDRSKTYPRAAKRRGMQGSVKVKFTILANGQVSNIRLSGSKLFHSSARNAVQKAFPINVKNAPLSLPQTVNVTLRYQLR